MQLIERIKAAGTRRLTIKPARMRADAPIASVSFDDFPKSAWTAGGTILAEFGARGTYYAAGSFCGRTEDGIDYFDAEDLRAARAAGHEIGCHSYAHRMAPQVDSAALITEADRNAAFLGERPRSYAYPYGEASPRTKRLMARRFESARGVYRGVNAGRIDLSQLKAIPIEHRRWRPDEIDGFIEEAQRTNGWLIFFTHDVSAAPSPFGATPQMLETVLEKLAAAKIACAPVAEAMERCGLAAR